MPIEKRSRKIVPLFCWILPLTYIAFGGYLVMSGAGHGSGPEWAYYLGYPAALLGEVFARSIGEIGALWLGLGFAVIQYAAVGIAIDLLLARRGGWHR